MFGFYEILGIITLIISALVYLYYTQYKNTPQSRNLSKGLKFKNSKNKAIWGLILIAFATILCFMTLMMLINTDNYFGRTSRHIRSIINLVLIIAFLPILFFAFVAEYKRDSITEKKTDILRKGLKLIKSDNVIARTRGLLLLARLLRQQTFTDEVNKNTRNIDLESANLANAKLSGIDLTGANLSNAILTRADLPHASLPNANLSKADLSQTYMPGTNLSYANLSEANFSNAFLNETNLSQVKNIGQANFNGVVMNNVKMDETTFDQFKTVLSEQQQSKILVEQQLVALQQIILVTIPEN